MIKTIEHVNTNTRDHDSYITGYGKHDRVICFCPSDDHEDVRIDHGWNLGDPTDAQIVSVFKRQNGIGGKWRIIDREREGEHTYVRIARA